MYDQARSILQIPTPKVFAWGADACNPVRSEYIIMEKAAGAKLDDIWDDLSLEQRITIMKALISLEKKMASISFNRSSDDASIAPFISLTETYLWQSVLC